MHCARGGQGTINYLVIVMIMMIMMIMIRDYDCHLKHDHSDDCHLEHLEHQNMIILKSQF